MADMWIDPSEDPREQLQPGDSEKATVTGYLEAYRLTLKMKCEGLTPEQMATRSVPPSDLSLLGMVRHMARVEHKWFRSVLGGAPETPRIHDDGTGGFTDLTPTEEGVAAAWESWRTEVEHARALWAAWPEEEMGAELPDGRGGALTVRDLAVHMVEEYARHMGHVDLLRECIDGRTGQ